MTTTVLVPAPTATQLEVLDSPMVTVDTIVSAPPNITIEESGGVIVQTPLLTAMSISVHQQDQALIMIEQSDHPLVVNTTVEQGPAGPPGATGGQPVYAASHSLSGHKVIKVNVDDTVSYADCTVSSDAFTIVGITTQAYVSGDLVYVQTSGTVTHLGWSWAPGYPILIGLSGELTQSIPPSAVFVKQIGVALSTNTIALNLSSPAVNI